MSSESGQRLPMEELKWRNAPQSMIPQNCPSKEEWQELLHRAGRAGAAHGGPHSPYAGGFQTEGAVPHPGADGGADAGYGESTAVAATGWEEERDFCFSAQSGNGDVGHGMAGSDFAGDYGGYGGLAGDLVRLGRSLERDQAADPIRDATTMHQHTDRKALRRERQIKIALGHKEDDHEEEPTWQQTM